MVSKEFIPYEEALALKELGFNEKECLGFWSKIHGLFITKTTGELNENAGECKAPLYQQAFRWFRDSFNYHHYIEPIHRDGKVCYEYCVVDSSEDEKQFNEDDIVFTYEEAELECLKKLIEIIKNK